MTYMTSTQAACDPCICGFGGDNGSVSFCPSPNGPRLPGCISNATAKDIVRTNLHLDFPSTNTKLIVETADLIKYQARQQIYATTFDLENGDQVEVQVDCRGKIELIQ